MDILTVRVELTVPLAVVAYIKQRGRMIEIAPEICRKTLAQYEHHDSGRGSADWPAYLRLLDRIDPSYRT